MRTNHLALLLLATACGDDTPAVATTTRLIQFDSCAALESGLTARLKDYADVLISQSYWGPPLAEGDAGGQPTDGSGGGPRQEGVDFSGTNNQEAGVDEGDFVKTDGYYIYALANRALRIYGVPEFGALTTPATLPIEGWAQSLLLDTEAGRAIVFSMVSPWELPADHPLRPFVGSDNGNGWYSWWPELTKVTVVDIADRAAPTVIDETYFEGYTQMSRRIDDSVRFALYSWGNYEPIYRYWDYLNQNNNDTDAARAQLFADLDAMTLEQLIPRHYQRTGATVTPSAITEEVCRSFAAPTNSSGFGIASIYSRDLAGGAAFDEEHVLANYGQFYASTDKLVLADNAYDWWWFADHAPEDKLNVHVFDIATPGQTTYVGSGRVDGSLSTQFAMDEQDGRIRVATTSNAFGWWGADQEESSSNVFVLEPSAEGWGVVGELRGLAPGERIYSARFLEDKAFLVTFRQIDPLFTIDLSNPVTPVLRGELKVPGVSTYIHPLEGDKLLTIGIGGDEDGAQWWNTTVSLFDVSNFDAPALADSESLALDQSWYAYSEAQWDHHAFQYFAPKSMLAVPLEGAKYYEHDDNNDGFIDNWVYEYMTQLELITVGDAGLSRTGSISHSAHYDISQCWWSPGIRRSIFMGDFIYAISNRMITAHRLSDLGEVAAQELNTPPSMDNGCGW